MILSVPFGSLGIIKILRDLIEKKGRMNIRKQHCVNLKTWGGGVAYHWGCVTVVSITLDIITHMY